MVCPLDTAAVTELWRLDLFSCTSSSFLNFCWYAVSERKMLLFFAGGLVGVDKHLFQTYYFHDSTTELYFRSTSTLMLFQNKNN